HPGHGVKRIKLDSRGLASTSLNRAALIAEAGEEIRSGRHCLIATSAAPEQVEAAQARGREQGMTAEALGLCVVGALADLTLAIIEEHPVGALISAGGETSGALCRRLQLGALRVGRNIEPGVPRCHSLGRFQLPVVLKSGNFGSADFYSRAIDLLQRDAD
ncbi:MAG: hypothetical protein GY953_44660, partial [bacterium]|nr:hypothetical protein [bacterium]